MQRTLDETVLEVRRMKTDLYNGDNDPESGLVPEVRLWLSEERRERQKRWKRSDKLALAGIMVVVLAWPTQQAVSFFSTLFAIAQEWREVHKGDIPTKQQHGFFAKPEPATAEIKPESATIHVSERGN